MKKVTSKVLTMLLAMTLIFTSAGVAFAGTSESLDKEKAFTVSSEKAGAYLNTVKGKISTKSNDVEEPKINAATLLTSGSKEAAWTSKTMFAGECVIIPVVAKHTGLMYLDAKAEQANSSYMYAYLAEDYDIDSNGYVTGLYNEKLYLSAGSTKYGTNPMVVTGGSTYYIIVAASEYAKNAVTASVRAKVITTCARTLTQGSSSWAYASGQTLDKNGNGVHTTTYFKIKPTKTGLMTVSLSEPGDTSTSAYITLTNSSKKVVSDKVYKYNYNSATAKAVFGVKKGNTYYIKVQDCYGSYSKYHVYGVKYNVSALSDKAYGSKSKAKTLTRGANSTSNLFVASTGTSTDWYKFKVTKKRTTVLSINTSGMDSGKITFTVYNGSKKIASKTISNQYSNGGEYQLTYGTTYGKANSGTYYVKVVKDKTASGKYTIRYKK